MLHTRVSDSLLALEALPVVPLPRQVLLASPEHFDVTYVINPHMEGKIGTVDRDEAQRQWEALRDAYGRLNLEVHTLKGERDLPDMVFCANQTLPYHTQGGERGVVLSRMHAAQRRAEVEYFRRFFREQGYETVSLPDDVAGDFEGMGDAIWHPGRYLLWGGYGYRTDVAVYEDISRRLDLDVIALSLVDADFYHLDTCFCPFDERTVLIYPPAFDADGLALIHHVFERVLEAPEDDARQRFACNAHCPDGKHVLLQRGSTETVRQIREAGFEPVELDTSEFLKSGGSVFCMKMMFW
jgi:N-dimethylarginine dimethylaminohydrolase